MDQNCDPVCESSVPIENHSDIVLKLKLLEENYAKLKDEYKTLKIDYDNHMKKCSHSSDESTTVSSNVSKGKTPVKADVPAVSKSAKNEVDLPPLKSSKNVANHADYMRKRNKINVRFPRQARITSLLVMASNSKFLDPDLLSKKFRGVAILRVATAEEAFEMILLFQELFPRIKLDRIVISLGTNDLDHVIDDAVVVKRLGSLKINIQSIYYDALVTIMGLLPREDRDVDNFNLNILSVIENTHLFEDIDHIHLYDCKHVAKRHVGKLAKNLKVHLHEPESKIKTADSSVFQPPVFQPQSPPRPCPVLRNIPFPEEYPPIRNPRQQTYASAVCRDRGRPHTDDARDNILKTILNLLTTYCV